MYVFTPVRTHTRIHTHTHTCTPSLTAFPMAVTKYLTESNSKEEGLRVAHSLRGDISSHMTAHDSSQLWPVEYEAAWLQL